jgi:hypothetical protein
LPGLQASPLVGELGRPPLPGLQVERGPDHVEEGEEDKANVLEELGAAVEGELGMGGGGAAAYPEGPSDQGGHAEGRCVVAEPGEVESYLDPEVLRYLAEWLEAEDPADPGALEALEAGRVVQREHLAGGGGAKAAPGPRRRGSGTSARWPRPP